MRHGRVIVGTTDAALSELNIELSAGGRTWLSGAHSIGSTRSFLLLASTIVDGSFNYLSVGEQPCTCESVLAVVSTLFSVRCFVFLPIIKVSSILSALYLRLTLVHFSALTFYCYKSNNVARTIHITRDDREEQSL